MLCPPPAHFTWPRIPNVLCGPFGAEHSCVEHSFAEHSFVELSFAAVKLVLIPCLTATQGDQPTLMSSYYVLAQTCMHDSPLSTLTAFILTTGTHCSRCTAYIGSYFQEAWHFVCILMLLVTLLPDQPSPTAWSLTPTALG